MDELQKFFTTYEGTIKRNCRNSGNIGIRGEILLIS